jgi:hypothetical protein
VAESKVYERSVEEFSLFLCKLKKLTFENLPVDDSQVYERTREVFLMFLANKKMNF